MLFIIMIKPASDNVIWHDLIKIRVNLLTDLYSMFDPGFAAGSKIASWWQFNQIGYNAINISQSVFGLSQDGD